MSSKRKRSYNPRAAAIAAAIAKKYPYNTFGRAYVRKGSEANLANYGASWRAASAEQRARRAGTAPLLEGSTAAYSGRGRYNILRALAGKRNRKSFARIGGALVDRAVGAISGSGLYTGNGLYTGRGTYGHVTNNLVSSASSTHSNAIPQFAGAGDETGAYTVTHTEYVTDIFGPGVAGGEVVPFSLQAFPLNPGLTASFQWLSQIAQNYEEYEFVQLIYHYRSTTTDVGNTSTGQCGTVIMACNYNAASANFADKQSMMQYAHANSCKTTEDLTFGIECDPSKLSGDQDKYIRTSPVAVNQDLKTYDHGKMQVAVANSPVQYNGQPIGELWVSYKVMLRKPKLFSARGFDIACDRWAMADTLGAGIPGDLFMGAAKNTDYLSAQQNSLGAKMVPINTDVPDQREAVYGSGSTFTFLNHAAVKILLPASFAGNLRITCRTTGHDTHFGWVNLVGDNVVVNNQIPNPKKPFYYEGNIQEVFDHYAGTPAGHAVGTGVKALSWFECCTGASTNTDHHKSILQMSFYVRASTNGIDNIIYIARLGGNPGASYAEIVLEQYQTLGGINNQLTEPTDRIRWVNSSNQVVQLE